MAETLAQWFVQTFGEKIPSWLTVFIISMLPVLENRGGMIAARLLDMNMGKAFIISYIGNIIPLPFIMMFITKIFEFLRRFKGFNSFITKMEKKAEKNKDKVLNYKMWGLLLFVAIPIPGTGGWTGALIAALLELPKKKAIPITFFGVLIAGLIMTTITYGIGWIITGH